MQEQNYNQENQNQSQMPQAYANQTAPNPSYQQQEYGQEQGYGQGQSYGQGQQPVQPYQGNAYGQGSGSCNNNYNGYHNSSYNNGNNNGVYNNNYNNNNNNNGYHNSSYNNNSNYGSNNYNSNNHYNNNYNNSNYNAPYRQYPKKEGIGICIASMVLGLVGIIAWILPLVGYPVLITGLVLGIKGLKRRGGKGMAVAGIVLCAIFLGFTLINSIAGVLTYTSQSSGYRPSADFTMLQQLIDYLG